MPAERVRLVRLCAHLSGDAAAAEDLAQETLLEGWRQRSKVHDAAGYGPWLTAIARNMCRRWQRAQYQRQARCQWENGGDAVCLEESLADSYVLDSALERQELADFLDRRMTLLPSDVRAVLVERYVRESSHAEIAERLGLREDAVRVRVHRGRIALERVLRERFTEEAGAYGLAISDSAGWESSRIWCPMCGRQRLAVRFIPDTGEFSARCRGCHELDLTLTDLQLPDALRGVNGRKAALNRLLAWNHTYVTDALAGRPVSCPGCRHVAQAAVERREHGSPQEQGDSLRVRGHACGVDYNWELPGFALTLPEGRKFWKKHPRIRALPSYGVDADGTASLVTRFESVTDSASLEAVFALDTLRVLGVYGPATHVADDD